MQSPTLVFSALSQPCGVRGHNWFHHWVVDNFDSVLCDSAETHESKYGMPCLQTYWGILFDWIRVSVLTDICIRQRMLSSFLAERICFSWPSNYFDEVFPTDCPKASIYEKIYLNMKARACWSTTFYFWCYFNFLQSCGMSFKDSLPHF